MRQAVFKLTNEDWYPSYSLGNWYEGAPSGETKMVEVSFIPLLKWEQCPDPGFRVCVWGNDDHGMERDYPSSEQDDALAMFYKIVSWEMVTHDALEADGFTFA
jgi:hypothetical protein